MHQPWLRDELGWLGSPLGLADTFVDRLSSEQATLLPLEIQVAHHYGGCWRRLVQRTLQQKVVLGSGSRATVYAIAHLPEVVLHVPHGLVSPGQAIPPLVATSVPDVMPGYNVGQAVATLWQGQLRLLRYQPGETYAFSYTRLFERYNIDEVLGYHRPVAVEETRPCRAAYAAHLHRVAHMPQSAYDLLAATIAQLPAHGLFFDPCGLNVLLDAEAGCFRTVDHLEEIGPYANVLGMACALMDTIYVDLDAHALNAEGKPDPLTVANDPALVALRKIVLKKTLLAAHNAGLPFPAVACPKNRFGFHQHSYSLAYAYHIAGMGQQWQAISYRFKPLRGVGGIAHQKIA